MRKRPAAGLADYWHIFLRRLWWILVPAIVIGGGTIALVSKMPRIYRSQTLILVDPQKVPTDFVKPTVTTDVNNRLQLISQEILSRTNLQRIIDKFGLYRNERGVDRTLGSWLNMGKRTQEEFVATMRKNITVETVVAEQSREHELGAFRIAYEGQDPALVQLVTRELAALFIEENVKVREEQAEGTTRFIDYELEKARASLDYQERRIKNFKSLHVGSLPEEQAANLQVLGQLQTAFQANAEALDRAQTQKTYEESLLNALTAHQRPAQSELELRREELKRAESRYTPLHPDVMRLREEVSKLEKSSASSNPPADSARLGTPQDPASDQIRGQIAALDEEIKLHAQQQADIEQRIEQTQNAVNALPAVEQQMLELDRDYQISKLNYASLLEKRNASTMAGEMERRSKGEQFRVLDPADYPEKPLKPEVARLCLLGVLGGILTGCALGLWKEFQDKSMHNAEDATYYLRLPALGSFPFLNYSSNGNAGVQPFPKTLVAAHVQLNDERGAYAKEQFRIIRTRLTELMQVRPIRSIMVTSAVQGEGKTWVATNLAISVSCLAQFRVLLVDADLKNVGLGKLLGVRPTVGLADYLADGNNLNNVRRQLQPNLAAVFTRRWEDDSAKLLSGQRMHEFLEESLRDHDLVVLDAPPVLALADAQVLTAQVDAVILVVRAGWSPYDLARNAVDLLQPKVVGLVVNGMKGMPVKGYHYEYSKTRRPA